MPLLSSWYGIVGGSDDNGNDLNGDLDHRVEMIAPDAPFLWKTTKEEEEEDGVGEKHESHLKTWWRRRGNDYEGLVESLTYLRRIWSGNDDENDNGDNGHDGSEFEGILGFSQGARLAHLAALLQSRSSLSSSSSSQSSPSSGPFPGLRYVILVGGYGHVPLPR